MDKKAHTRTVKAIVVREIGGPDVLKVEEVTLGRPSHGRVLVQVAYAGVNFHDVHHRSGVYLRSLPFIPGRDGSGVVLARGPGVEHLEVGDRVAFAMHDAGTYAQEIVVPAWKVTPIPTNVHLRTAAAVMLQGLTALSLICDEARVSSGQDILVHSAAGGTGSLMVQIARHWGARVIAMASTPEKTALAAKAGASTVSMYPEGGFSDWVRERTKGRGVDAVFSAVGGQTLKGDIASLAVRGHLVIYGRTGGPLPMFDLSLLANGNLTITYSRLSYYVHDSNSFQKKSRMLFSLVQDGVVGPVKLHEVPFTEARAAHRALSSRESVGKYILDMTAF